MKLCRVGREADVHCLHSKTPAALVDGRELLFPGEFVVASANVAALLLYNSPPEDVTICTAPKEGVNATAIL